MFGRSIWQTVTRLRCWGNTLEAIRHFADRARYRQSVFSTEVLAEVNALRKGNEEIRGEMWRDLYALASKVYETSPWEWMSETDVFGVELPGREVFFVRVMGKLGEQLALVVYPGIAELTGFWKIEDTESEVHPDQILEIAQLHTPAAISSFTPNSSAAIRRGDFVLVEYDRHKHIIRAWGRDHQQKARLDLSVQAGF